MTGARRRFPPRLRARLCQIAFVLMLWAITLLGIAALVKKYGPRWELW